MSALKVTTKEGMIEHVEIENTTLFGGSEPSSGTRTDRNSSRAFGKRPNSGGTSAGNLDTNQVVGNIDIIGGTGPSTNVNERIDITDRSGQERQPTSTGDASGSRSEQTRSGGNRYGIESKRPGESTEEYKRRYKREYRRAERAERDRANTEGDSIGDQEIDLVESAFSLTVEDAPIVGGESLEIAPTGKNVPRETKATPRSRKGSKYKEPNKDNVNLLASSLQDIYSLTDGGISLASILMDKFYIPGTFELDADKAEKMAHALARMNVSTPKLAEYINKYSAPMTFFSVMLMDLVSKGVMVRGMWQQQQPSKTRS